MGKFIKFVLFVLFFPITIPCWIIGMIFKGIGKSLGVIGKGAKLAGKGLMAIDKVDKTNYV